MEYVATTKEVTRLLATLEERGIKPSSARIDTSDGGSVFEYELMGEVALTIGRWDPLKPASVRLVGPTADAIAMTASNLNPKELRVSDLLELENHDEFDPEGW